MLASSPNLVSAFIITSTSSLLKSSRTRRCFVFTARARAASLSAPLPLSDRLRAQTRLHLGALGDALQAAAELLGALAGQMTLLSAAVLAIAPSLSRLRSRPTRLREPPRPVGRGLPVTCYKERKTDTRTALGGPWRAIGKSSDTAHARISRNLLLAARKSRGCRWVSCNM